MKHNKRKSGFSLVEVVVSVGIFAVAIVGIIGLFAPTTKNVAAVADSDGSTRAVAAIQSYLKEQGFTGTKSIVDAGTKYYANKGANVIGNATLVTFPNNDKFFEFTLTRNTDLSKPADDDTAGFLAFTINLKWPAYTPTADGVGVAVADNQKSSLIVPAAVTR
jgi:Tfp pilus assembly protein PilV